MKTITTSVLSILLFSQVFGQSNTISGENSKVKYFISNNGKMFNNAIEQKGGYLIPKDSLTSAIYAMMPMMAGLDINGQLKGAAVALNQSDFFHGPIADNYLTSEYLATYSESIWFMSKGEVENHRDHFMDPGYTMSSAIENWPGNGNTANGEAAILAPFYDVNQDGIYSPMEGDYPLIRGDKALYTIVNDAAGIHSSGLNPIHVEMHIMVYQFENNSDPLLTNTTFVLTTLYNRGTQTLDNFHFGHLIDFDLGGNMDDYIGTDVNRNLSYVYNGDLYDENYGGMKGYGINPPAVGLVALDRNLNSNIPLTQDYNIGSEIFNSLIGVHYDGSPFMDNTNHSTHYVYTGAGTGWNEATAGDAPGDRRVVTGYAGYTLRPFSTTCFNNAIVYARSNDSTLFASVDSLLLVTDHIQEFFDNQDWLCHTTDLGVNESKLLSLELYPNPAQNKLSVSGIDSGRFRILTLDGKEIKSGNMNASGIDVETLKNGFYILEITSNGKQGRKAFVKE